MAVAAMHQRLMAFDARPVCELCEAGANAVYADAREANVERLSASRAHSSTARANAALVRTGEKRSYVHALRRGWAMRVAHLSDGRRQILGFYVPGDLFDIETLLVGGDPPASFTIRALTEVEVCSFPIETMRAILHGSTEQRARFDEFAHRELAYAYRRMTDIGQRTAQGRMAQLFLELFERLTERGLVRDQAFEMPARQEHLADALGMTPVHVNRTLRSLKDAGLIEQDRREMRIVSLDGLRAVADEQ